MANGNLDRHIHNDLHISGFSERSVPIGGSREHPFRTQLGSVKNVDIFCPDRDLDAETLGKVFNTLVEFLVIEEEDCQLSAYVASVLNIVMPMTNEWKAFFKSINCVTHTVNLPSEMEDKSILSESGEWWSIMSVFVQFVLLLYKNVSDDNYMNYMNNRVIAARSFLSAPDEEETIIILSVDKAKIVKRILGGSHKLRNSILMKLLSARLHDDAFGQMCSYLCSILAWTEMSYLNFIYEEIILTDSPIMSELSVAHEINNLTKGLTAVLTSPYPQYYKIMIPPSQQRYTERSRFPLLIAAATGLKRTKAKSARFYAAGVSFDEPAVAGLIALHMRTARGQSTIVAESLGFLKGTARAGLDAGVGAVNPQWEA